MLHIILEKKIYFLPRSCDKSILKELCTVKIPECLLSTWSD